MDSVQYALSLKLELSINTPNLNYREIESEIRVVKDEMLVQVPEN